MLAITIGAKYHITLTWIDDFLSVALTHVKFIL